MRLERQIAELKGLESESGKALGAREKKQLEEAERDLARVKKARETVGAPTAAAGGGRGGRTGGGGQRGGGGGGGDVLGKRRRESTWGRERSEPDESLSDTDESVRRIPMPRDTPPPIPRRRPVQQQYHRHHHQQQQHLTGNSNDNSSLTNANLEPLGHNSTRRLLPHHPHDDDDDDHPFPSSSENTNSNNKPESIPKTVYESKPVVRDLRKEAVQKFVPVAVQRKLDASRGGEGGRLLEEEEMSQLEKGGYGVGGVISGWRMKGEAEKEDGGTAEQNKKGQDERAERRRREEEVKRLREEEERFEQELAMEEGEEGKFDRAVTVEEVQDEGQ